MRPKLYWIISLIAFPVVAGCGHKPGPTGQPAAAASPIRFRDVTQQSGIAFERFNGAFGKRWMPETMGGGGAFIDIDNNGLLDVVLVNGDWWPGHAGAGKRPTLAAYRNNGNGTFTDVTKPLGLDVSLQGMGVAVGDFDNDGWDDLFVTAVGGNRLFHNEGGKRFVDVTQRAGVGGSGWSTSSAWLDYDRDGKLDLFVCHYLKWSPATDLYCGMNEKSYCRPQEYPGESCRLYHNEGAGRFRDVTDASGIRNDHSKALGVCISDVDHDGWPDIVVANDMQSNFVFRNRQNGTFEEIGFKAGLALDDSGKARAGMGIDSAEYTSDGAEGLAIGNFNYEGVAFYKMTGQMPYPELSRQVGVYGPSFPYITFGVLFADFDNDGMPDFFITNGHIEDNVAKNNPAQTYRQPNILFRNLGDGRFADASQQGGEAVTAPIVGRGACWGDFDNDGRVDLLLVPNVGPAKVIHNESDPHSHWLAVKLKGVKSNRDGYGARVTVTAGGRARTVWVRSGSSYLSASDPRAHFGLAGTNKIDSIVVTWPNGQKEQFEGGPADRAVSLTEGGGRAVQ